MAQSYNVRLISDPLENGKSIFWNGPKEEIFFVDSQLSELYLYLPKSHKIRKTLVGPKEKRLELAFAFPSGGKKNVFIGGYSNKIISFNWNLSKNNVPTYSIVAELRSQEDDRTQYKICGANVDPQGILWVGTVATDEHGRTELTRKGMLFSMTKGLLKGHILPNISKVTAFAWDLRLGKMYLCDTLTTAVSIVDYDLEIMELSNMEDVFDVKKQGYTGSPSGLALDTYGFLWIAINGGSSIIQIDAVNRKILQAVAMPTPQVKSITFGNKGLDCLYVTTSKLPLEGEIPEHPAGCTCEIEKLGATGVAPPLYIP